MCYHLTGHREAGRSPVRDAEPAVRRLVTDGGTDDEEASGGDSAPEADDETTGEGVSETTVEADEEGTAEAEEEGTAEGDDGSDGDPPDRSNVEVTEAGEAEPASPEWDRPDVDDIPEFEVRADEPVVEGGGDTTGTGSERSGAGADAGGPDDADGLRAGGDRGPGPEPDPSGSDPTAGRPNEARSPGATRVATEGTDAYLVALELCARLPDDVRLPAEAADLVPAAVEAELEQDIQSFAASEFDTPRPHVDTLSFEEVDDEIWLRIRIGVPAEGFADVDPEAIRSYALQELEGVF